MSAVGKIFSGPKPDRQLQEDRSTAKRQAEEEKARADEKTATLRSARLRGTVGYSSLFGAGTAGGNQSSTKSLLG